MRLTPAILIGAMTLLAVAPPVIGQTIDQQGYRPVDQMVEDVDPLAVSLRRVDTGLLTLGERTNVYRRIVPGQDPNQQPTRGRLYYVSYGVVAEFDQSQYINLHDRRGRPAGIAQAIPPNTVFHIGLPDHDAVRSVSESPLAPGQVSGRVDGQVADRPRPVGPTATYEQLVQRQREVVIGVLGRTE